VLSKFQCAVLNNEAHTKSAAVGLSSLFALPSSELTFAHGPTFFAFLFTWDQSEAYEIKVFS
jgi:hypothetical protein